MRTTRVVRGTLSWPARAFGVVTYDASRVRDFNLKLDGWVRDLYVTAVGQRVRKNDPLLTLSSQELTGAQLQYLAALRSLQQLPPAQLADREYQERLIETPRQRLLYWDIPPDQLKALQDKGSALEAVTFRSPSDGVVIELAAVKGMHVAAGEMLYKIADSSVVWIEADFNTVEVEHLSDHASAVVTVDSLQQSPMSGRVLSQYPAVSDQTRTTRVRIEVPNPQGRLKPGMFARVEATVEPVAGLVVPDDAVLDSGLRQVVFVAQGDGHFEPRAVVAGARANGQVLILSGVREGELVVSRGAFLVDSESQLRAALEQFGEPQHRPDASQKNPRLTVRFGTGSEQPRASATDIQVEMRNADDTPMTDATVDAQFYMAPMPSMNMAAMRSSVRLTHVGGGVYRAREALSMAGRWDVTISATRDGVRVVSQQTSLVAR
ncbi:MAG TPA: FixH family protein [Vicinamibacterales bacterium]|nr:FixH family protein [Vicinamibacterales bacterium]